ncbi:MAG: chaperone modulator CbpM [Oleiphilaceae bacterium]|nr:chaperone modulator CbpM [Oleiphilaceae bacterium]
MAVERLTGEIIDEQLQLSLHDLCCDGRVSAEFVLELVEYGVLQPLSGREPREWSFAGEDLVRLHRALRLQRDLQVNLPGLALSLELLEELQGLRRRLADLSP